VEHHIAGYQHARDEISLDVAVPADRIVVPELVPVDGLLPDEQLLWSDRPTRTGMTLGNAGFSLTCLCRWRS
jgi:hypothetical protein